MAEGKLRVTLIRSMIGRKKSHKACVNGLGLARLHQSKELDATPSIRGMIDKVAYMLKVEEI